MITLITGAPGAGKTAALVSMLAELGKDRELWVNGIPELVIPHRTLDKPEEWPATVPDGAVVIIDEVQNVWRPRGPGSKVPDHVAALETHRHRGLDFYIITQGPNLVDANVRALVGRHVHLRDIGMLGRWWYEWPECADNCRTGWKNAPLKKRYKLPKKIFDSYKSASLHVKPVRSFPRMVVFAGLALTGTGLLTWKVYDSIVKKNTPTVPVVAPGSVPAGAAPGAPTRPAAPLVVDERIDLLPRISDRPWTAPAYDALRVVVSVPYITGAMCVNDDCRCYAGERRIVEVSSKACREWADVRPHSPYATEPGGSIGPGQQAVHRQSDGDAQRPVNALASGAVGSSS